jgi:hypothetical protein
MDIVVGDAVFGFSRGFVTSVTCTSQFWLARGDAITAAAPIETVTLTTFPGRHSPEGWKQFSEARWPRVTTWNLPQERLGGFAEVIAGMDNPTLIAR